MIRLVRFTVVSGAVALIGMVPDAAARWTPVTLGGTPVRDAVQRQRAPRHVALLIGIASYKHFSDAGEPGKTRLHAPVANDIPRMQRSLERWGFLPGDDVRTLTDSAASKAGIAAGFNWLIGRATDSADVVVIYYSGHGSWVRDADGDEARSNPADKADEALVPWDAADNHDARQLVIDDQIRAWLARIATKNVTVIVDACFSGTITRGVGQRRARGPQPAPNGGSAGGRLDGANAGHTLITAAGPQQTASEIDFQTAVGDRTFGVLTYYLTQALDAADSAARYDEVITRVRHNVSSLRDRIPRQDPQLEGDRAALLFRVRRPIAPRPITSVIAVDGDHATLDVGAVHGVRLGAVYDVYGPEGAGARGLAIAQVDVDSVGETRSRARIVNTTSGSAIRVGARGTMSRVPAGARAVDRVSVKLDATAKTLRAALDSLPFVTLVDSNPDAVVRLSGGVVHVEVQGLPLPPLVDDLDPDRIAVVRRDTGYVGSSDGLCPPLKRSLAIAAMRGVENPAPPHIPVQLRLVRGTAPPNVVSTATTDTVFVGETYSLFARVTAPPTSTLYLTVAVEGFIGQPNVVYPPNPGVSEPLMPNRWHRLRHDISIEEPIGREVLKAVVSSRPFDLHALVNALPVCTQRARGTRGERWRSASDAVVGWATAETPVIVVNRRSPRAR